MARDRGKDDERDEPEIQMQPNPEGDDEGNGQVDVKKPLEAEFPFVPAKPAERKVQEEGEEKNDQKFHVELDSHYIMNETR